MRSWIRTLPLVIMFGVGMVVGNVGCDNVPSEAGAQYSGQQYVELYEQRWGIGGWKIYNLRHASGACFVVLDPPGEGGGAITEASEKVCGDPASWGKGRQVER